MTDDLRPPYRIAFDNARDPYTARNALGIAGTGAGLITSVTPPLSVTGGNLTIDLTGYGNVSNSGTPVAGQVAEWTDATHIQGVSTYAKLASPALTGTPTAPTAAAGTNSTQIATTAFVQNEYATRSLFRATMSADQGSFSAGTYFQVLFNTAAQNVGGHYNTTTQRWTPPAGRVMLNAYVWTSSGVAGSTPLLALYKNGAAVLVAASSENSLAGVTLTTMDVANGTDYYSIYFQFTTVGGGGGTVFKGATPNSWFSGALL